MTKLSTRTKAKIFTIALLVIFCCAAPALALPKRKPIRPVLTKEQIMRNLVAQIEGTEATSKYLRRQLQQMIAPMKVQGPDYNMDGVISMLDYKLIDYCFESLSTPLVRVISENEKSTAPEVPLRTRLALIGCSAVDLTGDYEIDFDDYVLMDYTYNTQ